MTNEEAINEIEKLDDWISKQPSLLEDWCKTSDALYIATQALKAQPSENYINNYIKHKIDYLEDLASIETNEGRWREEEKYLYAINVLEEIVEYINTSGGGEE